MAENKGTWLDTKTNKVVNSRPEEGVQLVAPGVDATPDELSRVEAVKADLAEQDKAAKAGPVVAEPVDPGKTVTSTGKPVGK